MFAAIHRFDNREIATLAMQPYKEYSLVTSSANDNETKLGMITLKFITKMDGCMLPISVNMAWTTKSLGGSD